MVKYIDIHNHCGVSDDDIIAHPTISLFDIETSASITKFWSGVHPYDTASFTDNCINILDKNIPYLIGIGEIGLDYSIYTDRDTQKMVFEKQYLYAINNRLPVTIHCVKAYNDILVMLKTSNTRYKWAGHTVLHSFIGSIEMAKSFTDLGCFLSFSPTSLKSPRTIEALKKLPIENIFLETDNETSKLFTDIRNLYKQCADIRNMDVYTLKEKIDINYKKFTNII